MSSLLLFLFLLLSILPLSNPQLTNYTTSIHCPLPATSTSFLSTQLTYLDTNTLTCSTCTPPTVVVAAGQDRNDGPCICKAGYFLSSTDATCKACTATQASSFDRLACLECPTNALSLTSKDNTDNTCNCPTGSILIDRDPLTLKRLTTFTCTKCPVNKYPSDDQRTCVPCSDENMIASRASANDPYVCTCDTDLEYNAVPQGGRCVLNSVLDQIVSTYPSDVAFRVDYVNVIGPSGQATTTSIKSELFETEFYRAAAECQISSTSQTGSEPCQMLGNLCVLQMYDETSAACRLYQDLARKAKSNVGSSFPDWPRSLPWLYYNLLSTTSQDTVTSKELNLDVSFGKSPLPGTVSALQFVLATYRFNGSFIGFQNLTDQFQLCTKEDDETRAFLNIGNNYENECRLNLRNVIDRNDDTVFYDMYLIDMTDSLYPIPIRVTNFPTGSNTLKASDSPIVPGNRLVRRLFMIDAMTSRQSSLGNLPRYLRYAETITLNVPKRTDTPGKLSVPYLDVTYAVRDTLAVVSEDGGFVSSPWIAFKTRYFMTMDNFWRGMSIVFALVCMLAAVLWLYRCFSWTRRNLSPGETIDVQFFVLSIVLLCGTAGPFFAWLLYGISCYWMIFFKAQNVVYILLPTSDEDLLNFFMLLTTAFMFQLIDVLWNILEQCKVDIFFLDWERSRGRLLNAGNEEHPKPAPVSIWRSVFMANEWNRIQNYRQISVEFSLIWMVFLLKGLNLRYLSTAQPNAEDLSAGKANPVLLFCVNTSVWGMLAIVQATFRFVFYDRFYRNRLMQFVDILSMANISFLCFDERSHGFYIHGRSVHVHSDTDMGEMTANLKKEENDMVSRRGLNDTDHQTFEIFVTRNLRETYDKVYSLLIAEENRQRAGENGRLSKLIKSPTPGSAGAKPHIATTESIRAYDAINRFLCGFIDNNMKDHRYVVREMTYTEKITGVVPDMAQGSVFYHDPKVPFSRLLLYGMEFRMLTLYGLLFTLVDYTYSSSDTGTDGSTVLAALVVYLVDVVLRMMREHFGERNLAAKTLVDWRFLL